MRDTPPEDHPYNLGRVLADALAARGAEPVLRCDGRAHTGPAIASAALAFQAALGARGLDPGDRVLLLLRDTPAFFAAFIGAMRGGFVPVPISTLAPPSEIAFISRDAGVCAVVVDAALPADLRDTGLFGDVWLARASGGAIEGIDSGEAVAAVATRAGDPAFWLYTSGTTGRPKGVIHRHVDAEFTARQYAQGVLELGPGDRVLSAAKLFFAYGLGNALTFPLLLGSEIVLHPDRPTPGSMFELIEREVPTVFFGVPPLYAAMLAHSELPERLGRVRLCVSAGEALPAPLFERWKERFGVEILDGLGSTEMLHIFLSNRPGAARPGSSGMPVPGYRLRVIDEARRDVRDGEIGALIAHGASAARAYHDRPAETAQTMFSRGWLRTGDSYRRDPEGFYYHVGRTDDLIKVSGQYVSPVEVESALMAHPAVVESAVVGATDENGLLKPKAFVVLRADSAPSDAFASELQAFVKARLAPHKYPRQIEFVDALPKTATGKVRRVELRKEVRG